MAKGMAVETAPTASPVIYRSVNKGPQAERAEEGLTIDLTGLRPKGEKVEEKSKNDYLNEAQNKPSGSESELKDRLKGRLIKAAASLATNRLSELDHDYPERFPKWVLREIEKHNDRLRLMTMEIRDIANSL